MSIILTMFQSDREFVSGIPEYIELDTNKPSTIFYTLDGTVPDALTSDMFVDKIYLPTNNVRVELNAIALSTDGDSDLFTHEFYTTQSGIDGRRLVGDEGINILKVGEDVVDSLSFDIDGYAAQESAIELQSLDIKTSSYDSSGYKTDEFSSHSFINFPDINNNYDEKIFGSTSSDSIFFNPKAGYIEIDGRTRDAIDSQEVRVINRTSGSFSTVGSSFNDHLLQAPPVTGNLVKSFYDSRTGIYTSYYYESRECRWIVSKQSVEKKSLSLGGYGPSKNRHVFRWVKSRHMSKLY
tara:strand:+ start:773 stop:1657 length:885 start_codon:yes stop_codon:yes gene_type:complete